MDKPKFSQLQESYKGFFQTELGKHLMQSVVNIRETKLKEAEMADDPLKSAFLLQNARGAKIVIEFLETMQKPLKKK